MEASKIPPLTLKYLPSNLLLAAVEQHLDLGSQPH